VFHLWETSKWMSAPWSSAGGSVVVMPYTYARDSVDVVSSMFSILLFLYLDVHISHMSWLVQLVQSVMWNPDGKVLLAGFNGTTSLAALHFAGRPPSLDVHLLPLDLPDLEAITGGHGTIERMAWDGTGERLAVAFGGVVDSVYDGLVALFDTRQTPIVSMSLLGFIRGPGRGAKPLALAFHEKLKQGALLSLCWSTGVCCTYPLLFRGH
jgi:aladin